MRFGRESLAWEAVVWIPIPVSPLSRWGTIQAHPGGFGHWGAGLTGREGGEGVPSVIPGISPSFLSGCVPSAAAELHRVQGGRFLRQAFPVLQNYHDCNESLWAYLIGPHVGGGPFHNAVNYH